MQLPDLRSPRAPAAYVPWSLADTWIGVGLLVLTVLALLLLVPYVPQQESVFLPALVLAEIIYLVPVAIVLAWRRVSWRWLGFRRFEPAALGIGCGLLVFAYSIILFHNLILQLLDVRLQGDMIMEMLNAFSSPVWLIVGAVIVAPPVEELFFRGFLFAGFRQRYGWIAALLVSSTIFAIAHLDPASLIPTFVLGCVLAYVYHWSGSLWPGIILHFLVNSFGLCAALAAIKLNLP